MSAAPALAAAAPFAAHIITCLPRAWPAWLGPHAGLVGRAFAEGKACLRVTDLRDFGLGRHRNVDDTPYGGGPGMILAPGPLAAAVAAARAATPGPVVFLAPRGKPLAQRHVNALAGSPGLILVCGRYEGFDERAYALADEIYSAGDYILSGGDPAALCLLDAVVRRLPGVLGNAASIAQESFAEGLLEYPQYTRPPSFAGQEVPAVLCRGDHAVIARWRREQAERLTAEHRPDLFARYQRPKPTP